MHSRALAGDAEALLNVYVLASGGRQLADVTPVQRAINNFLEQAKNDWQNESDPWRRAEGLYLAMHRHFLTGGYDADQSALTGIFTTGRFNCISASLLYIVLARHFNVPVQGVLMPSHAFVEITLADGRGVEVETTHPQGFGVVHNQAFYERAAQWVQAGDFAPSTLEDYRKRKKVSALALGAMNMLNQHTRPELMSREDAFRLAEISAYFDPSNALAQEKRLQFYTQEINTLSQANSWNDAAALLGKVLADIETTTAPLADNARIQEKKALLQFSAPITYAHLGNTALLSEHLKRLSAQRFPPALEQHKLTAQAETLTVLFHTLADKKTFEEGLFFLAETYPHLGQQAYWPEAVNLFYSLWAKDRWQQEDWPGVVDILEGYLLRQDRPNQTATEQKNLTGAYRNWVQVYLNRQDRPAAQSVLDACVQKPAPLNACGGAAELLKLPGA